MTEEKNCDGDDEETGIAVDADAAQQPPASSKKIVAEFDDPTRANAFGIPIDRSGGSCSEAPKVISGDDDTFTLPGFTASITSVVSLLQSTMNTISEDRTTRKERKKAAASAAPDGEKRPASQSSKKRTVDALKKACTQLEEARDAAVWTMNAAVHAALTRGCNPEALGYGSVLQVTPEPLPWVKKERPTVERKKKRRIPPQQQQQQPQPPQAPGNAVGVDVDMTPVVQDEQPMDVKAALAEPLPIRYS
jgi:hypothetical protein